LAYNTRKPVKDAFFWGSWMFTNTEGDGYVKASSADYTHCYEPFFVTKKLITQTPLCLKSLNHATGTVQGLECDWKNEEWNGGRRATYEL